MAFLKLFLHPADQIYEIHIFIIPSSSFPGICQPRDHSRAFDMHAVSYQNITIHMILLEKKQIGSSVKDRN